LTAPGRSKKALPAMRERLQLKCWGPLTAIAAKMVPFFAATDMQVWSGGMVFTSCAMLCGPRPASTVKATEGGCGFRGKAKRIPG
jgi:hypothetical protein